MIMVSKNAKIILISSIIVILLGSLGLFYIRVQRYHTIQVNGIERQYQIYIPESYSPNQPVPLLLGLHGALGNADQFRRSSDFNHVAEKYGFIVVYPDGLGTTKYNYHYWNSGHISGRVTEDDVAFLYTLIAELKTQYAIDSQRIYMVGHSNGAMMTYRMAGEHPELFAAVASVSGTIGTHSDKETVEYINPVPKTPINIVHIHGTKDEMVLYEGGVAKGRDFYSVNETISFWLTANNCSSTPTVVYSSNSEIKLSRYSSPINNATVTQVDLIDRTHAWSNMNKAVKAEEFKGTGLAEMIWSLLQEA
jgi:polyhydroxybutyrate depolymerase